jgi:hypothetical protein
MDSHFLIGINLNDIIKGKRAREYCNSLPMLPKLKVPFFIKNVFGSKV